MQLDVEVSPPAFVKTQFELECTRSVLGVYVQCRLNVHVGCIGFAVLTCIGRSKIIFIFQINFSIFWGSVGGKKSFFCEKSLFYRFHTIE